MTYEEFEWRVLRMVYEEGVDSLQPAYLAYTFELSHDTVSEYLERAVQNGLVEMDVNEEGRLEYKVQGIQNRDNVPDPFWKKEFEAQSSKSGKSRRQRDREQTSSMGQAREVDIDSDELPEALKSHIRRRYKDAQVDGTKGDGEVVDTDATPEQSGSTVVQRQASVDEQIDPETQLARSKAGEAYEDQMPVHVESSDDVFCDPSQTVLMRQLKVSGVKSEQALRAQVRRLFESVGYNTVESDSDRLRFERGSITFILALVPLFVLILPLFIYLFLYCMGRSTIEQEPVELDVQFRESSDQEGVYEVDLTFIGLHGVVLGAADQRILNKEVENLREELRWALPSSK